MLTFEKFHPTDSSWTRGAEGLLSSYALNFVVSVMLATILLFRFEGNASATPDNLAIAWSPLVLLGSAIVEFLFGLGFWYSGKNSR